MSFRSVSLRDFDWVLLGVLLSISALGVLEIYSTTVNTPFAGAHTKQLGWIGLGMVVMFIMCRYDYHELLNHTPWLYLGTLGLLVGVLVLGLLQVVPLRMPRCKRPNRIPRRPVPRFPLSRRYLLLKKKIIQKFKLKGLSPSPPHFINYCPTR